MCFLNCRNPSVHRHAPSKHPLLATRIEHCSSFTQSLPKSCAVWKKENFLSWHEQLMMTSRVLLVYQGMSILEKIISRHFLLMIHWSLDWDSTEISLSKMIVGQLTWQADGFVKHHEKWRTLAYSFERAITSFYMIWTIHVMTAVHAQRCHVLLLPRCW